MVGGGNMNNFAETTLQAFEKISKVSTYTKEGERYMGADGLIYCSKCNTPLQKPINFGGRVLNMPVMCQCQTLEEERNRKILEQQNHEVYTNRLKQLGFSNKYYLNCTFDKDDKANLEISTLAHKYVDRFNRFYAKGLGLLFMGSCGNGKTFISACIGNALIEKEYSVYMTSISDLVNLMSKDFGNNRPELIEKLSNVDLLILDDLGTENIMDSRKSNTIELTYKIIDSRYISNKPMIISTNLDISSMLNSNDLNIHLRRIFERILQRCKPFDLGSNNRRKVQSRINSEDFNSILEANLC